MKIFISLIICVAIIILASCNPPKHDLSDDLIDESIGITQSENELLYRIALNRLSKDRREESILLTNALMNIHNNVYDKGFDVPSRFISSDYKAQLDSLTSHAPYQNLPFEHLRDIVSRWRGDLFRTKGIISLKEAHLMRAQLDNRILKGIRNSINDEGLRISHQPPYFGRNGNIFLMMTYNDYGLFPEENTTIRVDVIANGNHLPSTAFSYSISGSPFIIEIDKNAFQFEEFNTIDIVYTFRNTILAAEKRICDFHHFAAKDYYAQQL